jgi:hypothetical protein
LGNFNRHKKSNRHNKLTEEKSKKDAKKIEKVYTLYTSSLPQSTSEYTNMYTQNDINNFKCKNCNFQTEHKSSYYRHLKKCDLEKKESDNELILKLKLAEKDKELLEKEKEFANKEIEMLKKLEKEKTELLNNFMNNANQIINKTQDNAKLSTEAIQNVSISAIKYANEKFQNAPPLLTLDNFNINNLDFDNIKDRESITETLVYHAKLKSLDKLLGEHIIKNYKKEDPKNQSIHTTDCSRLNYIVRELIDNVSKWEVDKNGIKICSKIIKPLIEKCIELLLEHQQKLLDDMSKGEFNNKNDINSIIMVLMSIDKGSLESDINKYIAPHFNINKGN